MIQMNFTPKTETDTDIENNRWLQRRGKCGKGKLGVWDLKKKKKKRIVIYTNRMVAYDRQESE